MRRVLFSILLVVAAFGVLANNLLEVTAPTIAGEIDDLASRQSAAMSPLTYRSTEAASLSGQPNGIPANPAAPPASAAMLDTGHSSPELAVLELPFEGDKQAGTGVIVPERQFPLFVSFWTELPMAASHAVKMFTVRKPPIDDLSADARKSGSPDETFGRIVKVHETVTAGLTSPSSDLSLRNMLELPDRPATIEKIMNQHSMSSETAAVNDRYVRNGVSADRQSYGSVPAMIAAWAQAPASLFQRARFVPLPEEPKLSPAVTSANEHTALFSPTGLTETYKRTLNGTTDSFSAAGSPSVFVTASYQTPSNDFSRPRIAAVPEAPKPVAVAAIISNDHTAYAAFGETANEYTNSRRQDADRSAISFSNFVSALFVAPSAMIEGMNILPMPERPAVAAPAAKVDPAHVSFNNFGAVQIAEVVRKPQPAATFERQVTISADTTMASNMITPMKRNVLEAAPLNRESLTASSIHDDVSEGSIVSQYDRTFSSVAEPARSSEQMPVLISGKPEFSMDLLKPMNASVATPFVKLNKEEVVAALAQDGNYCDPNWVGPPIRFSQTVELKLDDLIRQLHQRFGVNFIVGKGVADLPMNIKAGSIPWNVLLRSQLFISGVRARCIDTNTIELIENKDLPGLQDMADVETRFVKLKFLQRTGSGTVDLANRSQGGQSGNQGGGCGGNNQGGTSGSIQSGGGGQGGSQQGQTAGQLSNNKFDKLIIEIEKILGLRSMTESSVGSGQGGMGGQGGGVSQQQTEAARTNRFVTQIPGRNILAIRATKEEHELIDQIISRADRPPFQVVIKGLVYTANQDRLRDIGVQTTITGGTADNRSNGGIFGDTIGAGTLFDFSTILGTFDFNVQATAFQQNGVISVKSRPFATVIDGLCTTLDVGRQLPIVIDSTLGGQGDVVFVNAANNLAVTPYVIDDDKGDPVAVTLELRLTANDIDSSVTARGVPAISARSIQTQLLLGEDKTAILGGFTVDSDSRTVRKTPGLGDIPIIGELFKRRIRDTRVNRLYFAISVDVIPYPDAIRPVDVPGATTDPPTITPEMKLRSDKAEPKQVPTPKKDPNDNN